MPIVLTNGAALAAAKGNGLGVGARKASLFFSLRIVATPDKPLKFAGGWSGGVFAQRGNGSPMNLFAYGLDEKAQTVRMLASMRCQNSPTTPGVVVDLSANVNYFCCLTHDADDVRNQVLWINGGAVPMNTPAPQPLVLDDTPFLLGNASGGTYERTLVLGPVLFVNGYVATEADVWKHLDGVDLETLAPPAPTTAAGCWSLDGPVGSPVVAGGGGLANRLAPAFPLVPSIHPKVPGSSAVYSTPIPFTPQVEIGSPVVCSSGRTIEVPVRRVGVGTPLKLVEGRPLKLPTVTIAGGETFAFDRAVFSKDHSAAMYLLPASDPRTIPKNVAAVLDAPPGMLSTALGSIDASEGVPMINCSGRAKYAHKPKTAILGQQIGYPGASYYAAEQLERNLLRRLLLDDTLPTAPMLWPDRTLKQNYGATIWDTTYQGLMAFDKTSVPSPWGVYVLSWRNKDRSKPTEWKLTAGIQGAIRELTEYRLDNDADGECTRVYLVQDPEWSFKLAAPVKPDDVEIVLEDTTWVAQGVGGRMWLKFGGEYFDVQSIVLGTRRVKVGRAQMNTSAASHEVGEVGTGRWYRGSTGLLASVAGFGGVPLYDPDAVCYGPGDYELPAAPGPFKVDRSPAYARGLTAFFRDCIKEGWGAVRAMPGTGTFHPQAEPEHMRLDSDLYPGNDSKAVRAFRWVKARAVDPTNTPFVFSHQRGQEYSAFLLEPMDDAAPGAVEWVNVGHTPEAPILYGSRLYVGGECLRVIDVDGEWVQVVRGADDTTPTFHQEGLITVGWRVPITDQYQYTQDDRVYIEIETDVPHKMLAGQWSGDQMALDLNPLARIDVPLLIPVAAGSKMLLVAVPPDDARWGVIAAGLKLNFGAEVYTIRTVDKAASTITTNEAMTTAKPIGAVGKGSSQGVLCETHDGKLRGWTSKQSGSSLVWYPTGPTSVVTSLYCYLQGKPGRLVADQTFDLTPRVVGGVDQSKINLKFPYSLYSYEEFARLAAACPDSIVWVNIPTAASRDMVRTIARRVLPILPKGRHKIVIEKGNEIWNYQAPLVGPVYQQSKLYGCWDGASNGSWIDWWVLASRDDHAVFREEAAKLGRADEVLLSLPWQSGQTELVLSRARALGVKVDVASWAGYVTPSPGPGNLKAFAGADNAQVWDLWRFDYEHNAANPTAARFVYDAQAVAKHRALTDGLEPKLVICYETGTHSVLPIPPNGTTDKSVYANGVAKNVDCTYHPEAAHALSDWMVINQEKYGLDGGIIFLNTQAPAPLPAGSGYGEACWGFHSHHGQPDGKGDGSDGKHDNRTTLAEPGQPCTKDPTISVHALNVSVRGQWMTDWNREYYATKGPYPEP